MISSRVSRFRSVGTKSLTRLLKQPNIPRCTPATEASALASATAITTTTIITKRYASDYPSPSQLPNESMRKEHLIRSSTENLIKLLADEPLPTVSLNDLLKFNSTTSHHSKSLMLVENANETLHDMLVLVCKRLVQFMELPYIVILNPKIAEIYDTYLETLKVLLQFIQQCSPDCEIKSYNDFEFLTNFKIDNLEQNNEFIKVLMKTIDLHTDNLTVLSEGFEEILGLNIVDDKAFLNDHLKERILMRLLANHHILLSSQLINEGGDFDKLNEVGIIEKNVNVLEVLSRSSSFVNDMSSLKYDEKVAMKVQTVIINEDDSVTIENVDDLANYQNYTPVIFPYISAHIEYVLNEILKNSTRAHIENKVNKPVEALVLVNKPNLKKPGPQFYKLEVRITDNGKGIKPEILDKLFEYSFTTFDADAVDGDSYKTLNNTGANQANIIAGMGYGLPLSLTYNRLFHGDISLKSVYGHGTTVYLKWVGIDAKKLYSTDE
ncbi:hypothetical protein CANARDRAFT_7293 [[Candida] arabinofermentans NRRL YB-2248]|uniref:Protein-serine/threonine kinase n=1 Tax=[Candida] arabinofermentans NRRL YB-2248 TaxID=983967 RepID=A0A1E4T2F3_9ASCO|nr:hypothetical protein CANARDRAFT_7293 [[Candida] arabinofermentans NRRL YB-2248]